MANLAGVLSRDGSNTKDDVWWSQDGADWTKVERTNNNSERFSGRSGHQVAVHNDELWLVGGWNDNDVNGGRKNDVWRSQDGVNWEEVVATNNNSDHFSTRHRHQVVAHNNRLWLIAGDDPGSGSKNDVWWSEDGADWTPATASASFSAREGHQVVVHNNRLWVIGGGGFDSARTNDVWWSEDGVNWRLGFHYVFQFR